MTTEKTYLLMQAPGGFEVKRPKQLMPIATFSNKLDAEHYIEFLHSGGKVLKTKAHLASRIDTIQAVLDTAIDRHHDFRDEVARLAMGLDRALAGQPTDPIRDAAPDLLAALKAIDGYQVSAPTIQAMERFVADVEAIASRAIAKARGE